MAIAAESRKRAVRFELTMTGFADQRLIHLGYARTRNLKRKERFELSKRVWKTRMLPTTSLPLGEIVELLTGLEPATATFEASRSSS